MPKPTVRTLAVELGLSRSTVSLALRGSPLIKAATRERVRVVAARAGYTLNPLASSVMSELKRGHGYHGEIAVASMDQTDRPVKARQFRRLLLEAAARRAAELGYQAQNFIIGEGGVSLTRLHSILRARGIQGVLVLPVWREPDFAHLDWSHYAGVYLDYLIERPALPTICADFYRSMLYVLQHVQRLGYRRPGLFIVKPDEARLQYCWSDRWTSAFLGLQRSLGLGRVPPLVVGTVDREAFTRWFRRHRPDVVLGHQSEAVDWMTKGGARVPETHGFVSLNLALSDRSCAGLDPQPAVLAERGVELLAAQILHRQCGLDVTPSATMVPGLWRDGPTLRPRRD